MTFQKLLHGLPASCKQGYNTAQIVLSEFCNGWKAEKTHCVGSLKRIIILRKRNSSENFQKFSVFISGHWKTNSPSYE